MIIALAGGVGGARLAVGLAALLPPEQLTLVVNTGDDFEHLGLAISPDIDTVMYTLAGVSNPETGWGRADETWSFMETLAQLGGETWFRLGDRDLAVHVHRTMALKRGEHLSGITRAACERLGVRHAIVPMTDECVRTVVLTGEGELPFQEYFVHRKCVPIVQGFRFSGSESARMPGTLRAILDNGIEAVVVCPSNPYISIDPILSVTEMRQFLEHRTFTVVAVSPIIGGQAVKGPTAKMMRELGFESNVLAVVEHYGALVEGWIIDERDRALEPKISKRGKRVVVTETLMTDRERSVALARAALELAAALGSRAQ